MTDELPPKTDELPPKYDLAEAADAVFEAIMRRVALLLRLRDLPAGEDPSRFRARCELGRWLDGSSGLPEDFPMEDLLHIHLVAYRTLAGDDELDPEAAKVMTLCAEAIDRALEKESPEESLWNDEETPPIDSESFVRIGVEALGDPELQLPPRRYH